jgi:peptidoglycan/LPS O-acetylase OafA/YrhL
MLVLANHLLVFFGSETAWFYPYRKIGPVGVLFFFVHTSLVLMLSMERQEARFGRGRLFRMFIIRRCFRIYPLSILVVSLIFFLGIPNNEVKPHLFTGVSLGTFGFIANLGLFHNLFWVDSITGPLWSLPYEMQMYFFLPAIYLIAQRVTSVKALLGLWLVGMAIAVFPWPAERMQIAVQYVPCFLPGIIAYRLLPRTKATWPFWIFPIMLLAFAAWFVMGYLLHWHWMINGFSMCLALGLTLPHFVEVKSPAVRRVSHLIARYSYGIYLTHFPMMWFAFVALGKSPMLIQWAVFLAGLVGVPVLLYHALEAPMIRVGNRVVEGLYGTRKQAFPAPEMATDTASVP